MSFFLDSGRVRVPRKPDKSMMVYPPEEYIFLGGGAPCLVQFRRPVTVVVSGVGHVRRVDLAGFAATAYNPRS